MTTGSCSSLSFAYAANRANMKVLDFRGGNSCKFFSQTGNIRLISNLNGVVSFEETGYNDFVAVNSLLKNVEKNKEYYLTTGRHATIIRKVGKDFEYLELQTQNNNGFKRLTKDVLKKRFSCQKSHTKAGIKVNVSNILIDIETLANNSEIKTIIEYINTNPNNQKKRNQRFC